MIQGDQDDLVPEPDVKNLAGKLGNQRDIIIDYRVIDDATHFFDKQLDILSNHVESYLSMRLKKDPEES